MEYKIKFDFKIERKKTIYQKKTYLNKVNQNITEYGTKNKSQVLQNNGDTGTCELQIGKYN